MDNLTTDIMGSSSSSTSISQLQRKSSKQVASSEIHNTAMMAKDKNKFDEVKEEKKDTITTKIMGSSSRYVSQPCKVNMVKKLETKSSENHNTDMMAREEQKFTWEEELDMLTRFHQANVGFKCLTIDNEHEHDNDKFLKNEDKLGLSCAKLRASLIFSVLD